MGLTYRALEHLLDELCDRTPRDLPSLVATYKSCARASVFDHHLRIDRATGDWSFYRRPAARSRITRELVTLPIEHEYGITVATVRERLGRALEDLLDEIRDGWHEDAARR